MPPILPQVADTLRNVISDLSKEAIFVFCVVADNASAFQKAGRFFEVPELLDEDDMEISESDDGASLPDALQALSTDGVFCAQCAAHSLQLVWAQKLDFVFFLLHTVRC